MEMPYRAWALSSPIDEGKKQLIYFRKKGGGKKESKTWASVLLFCCTPLTSLYETVNLGRSSSFLSTCMRVFES